MGWDIKVEYRKLWAENDDFLPEYMRDVKIQDNLYLMFDGKEIIVRELTSEEVVDIGRKAKLLERLEYYIANHYFDRVKYIVYGHILDGGIDVFENYNEVHFYTISTKERIRMSLGHFSDFRDVKVELKECDFCKKKDLKVKVSVRTGDDFVYVLEMEVEPLIYESYIVTKKKKGFSLWKWCCAPWEGDEKNG